MRNFSVLSLIIEERKLLSLRQQKLKFLYTADCGIYIAPTSPHGNTGLPCNAVYSVENISLSSVH